MSQGRWRWHLGRIQNLAITDNVVDLLAERLKRLPDATQKTLKLAAAIGGRFNVSMLMATSNKSASETAANLWPAIQAGLILPIGDQYTLLQDELFNIYGKKNQSRICFVSGH
jgi:predicted ATPase